MILIAPDKFKGTFTASQICDIVASRLRSCGYSGKIVCRPMSDGGEGAREAFLPDSVEIAKGVYRSADGTHELAVSSEIVGFDAFSGSGLPLMRRSSFALGKSISPGIDTYIAIGGTATSDGGAGFLQGLGVRFFDTRGMLIREPVTPETICRIASADRSSLSRYRLHGIVDVKAHLTEPPLSALDFARQKALPGENIDALMSALRHLQAVLGGCSEWDGAGGGLGYALSSVAGAPCLSGAQTAVDMLAQNLDNVSLIITGEGRVDKQTVRGGKLVDALYRHASALGIPVLVLYGARSNADFPYPHMAQLNSDWEQTAIYLAGK